MILDLISEIRSRITRLASGWYHCTDCAYESKYKSTMNRHVEAKHIVTPGVMCDHCLQVCPTSNALISHKYRFHSQPAAGGIIN